MRRFTPYIVAVLVLGFVALIIVSANRKLPRQIDERITLREKDKIPYGFHVAKELSARLFPGADVYMDDNSPGSWDRISFDRSNQAVVIIGKTFNADEYELRQLMRFVEQGNYVFIIAQSFSPEAQEAFRFTTRQNSLSLLGTEDDSLRVRLSAPPFPSDSIYQYPGSRYESWFDPYDTADAVVLGRNEVWPNFLRMDKGRGSFFLHSAPLAFSNYFILHKNNIHYFEQAMSVLPRDVRIIAWNEFYLETQGSNRRNKSKEPDWLGVLLRFPAFRWGFGLLLFVLVMWVLLNSRRRQRMIPVHARPRNETLDFVKTMGRLYYEKRDHSNLARKMAAYFLEHVRLQYKLPTHNLDERFINDLHYKSGHSIGNLNEIVSFINYLQDMPAINEQQLRIFHDRLESFYQNA